MVEIKKPNISEPTFVGTVPRTLLWYRDLLLLLTVLVVLLADQISKYLVKTNLGLGVSWPENGLLRLTHGTNSGSAFGLFADQTPILIVASVIAIGFLVYFYKAYMLPSPMLRFAIGLLLGGAIGNLVDRLRAGTVVDFIDFGWWPIFNLADSSIVVGMVLLIGLLILGYGESSSDVRPSSGRLRDKFRL